MLTKLFFGNRYPSGLRGVSVVSLGLVQRQVWRVRHAAPHTLHPHAPSQQRSPLPPAGRRAEVLPRQLFMTRPRNWGEEGEKGEAREERQKSQKRQEGTETEKQHYKVDSMFTLSRNLMNNTPGHVDSLTEDTYMSWELH